MIWKNKEYEIGLTADGLYYIRRQNKDKKVNGCGELVEGDCLFMSERLPDLWDYLNDENVDGRNISFSLPYVSSKAGRELRNSIKAGVESVLKIPRGSLSLMPDSFVLPLITNLLSRG